MKLKQLNEDILIEKEVKGVDLKDIQFSPEVQKEIDNKNWQEAYRLAKTGGDEEQMHVIFVKYVPTPQHIKDAKAAGGVIAGTVVEKKDNPKEHETNTELSGYLQENPNSKEIKAGGLRNITNLGSKLLDVVDKGNVVREGYFKLLPTPEGATPFTLKDSELLIKKLKGIGSGIKEARSEKANRAKLGKVGSEKDAVVENYLEYMFGGDLAKIEPFKDYIKKTAVELKLNNYNPIINFVKEYIKTFKMERKGFAALNNLYANNIIGKEDLNIASPSPVTALLTSNLLENTPYGDVEYIVRKYKELLYSYRDFNTAILKAISDEKYGPDGPVKIFESILTEKPSKKQRQSSIIDKQNKEIADLKKKVKQPQQTAEEPQKSKPKLNTNWKKLLADAVFFKAGQVGKSIESLDEIEHTLDKLMASNAEQTRDTDVKGPQSPETTQPGEKAKTAIKVSGAPEHLSNADEARFKGIFSGANITDKDIPALIAYLKKNKLVG